MAPKKYCCCYPYDYGIVILGFLQLNAALFFWARFSTLVEYYCWLDLALALCYTVRATFFFIDLAMDSPLKTRQDFYLAHQITTYLISALGAAIVTMKWIEWAYVPTWTITSWFCCILLNAYHWECLKGYVNTYDESKVNSDNLNLNKIAATTSTMESELEWFESFNKSNKME